MKKKKSLQNGLLAKNQSVMLMDEGEAIVDCVTPYAIRNLTDKPIKISSLQVGGTHETICLIEPGEIKGLAVSFADTLNMSQSTLEDEKKVVSRD